MKPALVRNVIYPAYRFIRQDHVFTKLQELEKNQWLSKNELKELQWKKLELLLDYVYKNIPYYTQLFNELGLKPKDIQDPGDFRKIPILTKETIRNKSDMMISIDPSRKGIAANTGGSTGETLYFYKDLKADAYKKANLIRLNRWCGIDLGDKEVAFWGTPFDVGRAKRVIKKIKEYMKNIIYFSTFDMTEKTMLRYAKTIQKFKPSLLRGYPSALFTFTNFLKKNNIIDIKPKAVISTGEKTFPFQRELMEEVFGREVYERYGSNEFGNLAHECAEHKGLHLIIDLYYVEVMKDNSPAEKGEIGEIIVTDLHNYFMPFLRYRIGDLGVLSDTQCKCGRGFPVMEGVEGRSFDMIVTPSGKTLGGFFWTFISRAVPGIRQFQIVQREKSSIDFKIVPDKTFTIESQQLLKKEIEKKAGKSFKVNFKILDKIPLTPSGKFRFIMSEISKERLVMKSKIHKAVVTETNLDLIDSITVDENLMKKVNLREYEKVLIVDNTNGARLETCIIKGTRGSSIISMNGATTHLVKKGDEIIIIAFTLTDEEIVPQVILVDKENKFVQFL
jgi:phenylacetate-CoA ligase